MNSDFPLALIQKFFFAWVKVEMKTISNKDKNFFSTIANILIAGDDLSFGDGIEIYAYHLNCEMETSNDRNIQNFVLPEIEKENILRI